MNYPTRLMIEVLDPSDQSYLFVKMRGHLLAEPRAGGHIRIPSSIEMDGPALTIRGVEEDLEYHWLDVRLEVITDYSQYAAGKTPEEVLNNIEKALSSCGWYTVGPDGTAGTNSEW